MHLSIAGDVLVETCVESSFTEVTLTGGSTAYDNSMVFEPSNQESAAATIVAAIDLAADTMPGTFKSISHDAIASVLGSPAKEQSRQCIRPWGFYESLINESRFQVKRIVVNPGSQLSLQKHYHRSEHWVVVQGTAIVTCNETSRLLHENESIHLPVGCIHRLENPGRIALTVIEVQSGAYLGEDDIVRLEDVYGRE